MKKNYVTIVRILSDCKAYIMLFALLLAPAVFYGQCDQPININQVSLTPTTASFTWNAPATGATSYEYIITTGGSPGSPSGSTFGNSITVPVIAGLQHRFYVRSRCASNTSSAWHLGAIFTPMASGNGCASAPYGLHPAANFTPACTGNPEVVVNDAFAGEYSYINVIANRRYTFGSSNPTDHATIANANLSGIITHGTVPVVWDSGSFSGEIRYYLNSNGSCGTQQVERTRLVTCGVVPSDCDAPVNMYTHSITSTGATIHWAFTSTYHPTNYYISTSSATPAINVTPSGGVTSGSYEKVITNLQPNTTYYYWMRSNCSPNLSDWVLGGSFTTQATVVTGCTGALYGQEPSTPFTPACSGSPEIISTSMWAGQYSNINILPNKIYTFTSSVATDFITVRDEITSVAYASGTTPLVWSSGANTTQLKVFIHTNSSCGSLNVNRTFRITCQNAVASCAAPSSLTVSAITGSSANIGWVAASPAPSNGYQYYYSTSGTAPVAGTTPSGTTTAVSLNLTGLNANTTYYIWVRSNCGSSQSNWFFGNNFTTLGANAGCTTAVNGQYPADTFTPTCFGNNEIIVSDAYAGEYANVNITANTQYTFTSSVTSDYITITNADATITYVAGNTPLVWVSGSNSGVIRYYIHANSACASQNSNRIRYMACQAATACVTPTALSATGITTSTATLNWTASTPAPVNGYQYYYATTNVAPTASTQPSGNVTVTSAALTGLNPSTNYYYWIRSNCGTSQSAWSSGATFTTSALVYTGCTEAFFGAYPTTAVTPLCTGANETIVADAYAGEYSIVNVVANKQYTFTSSVATDFITIANAADTQVIISGTSPVVWQSGSFTGVIYYFLHTDLASCGIDLTNRSRLIACTNALADVTFNTENLRLFPNPTTQLLNISNDERIDSVALFNMLGQLVKQQDIHAKAGTIDMSTFAAGTYFARVVSGDKSKTLKVIKE